MRVAAISRALLLVPVLLAAFCRSEANGRFTTESVNDEVMIAGGAGAALGITGLVFNLRDYKDVEEERLDVDAEGIPGIDRFSYLWQNQTARILSDYAVAANVLLPLAYALLSEQADGDEGEIAALWAGANAFNLGLNTFSKVMFRRRRPFIYNESYAYPDEKKETDASLSFYSGHTAAAFTNTAFLISILDSYDKLTLPMAMGMITYSAFCGYLRIAAGKHFLTDVVTGAVVGTVIGYVLPKLAITRESRDENPSPAVIPLAGYSFAF